MRRRRRHVHGLAAHHRPQNAGVKQVHWTGRQHVSIQNNQIREKARLQPADAPLPELGERGRLRVRVQSLADD